MTYYLFTRRIRRRINRGVVSHGPMEDKNVLYSCQCVNTYLAKMNYCIPWESTEENEAFCLYG